MADIKDIYLVKIYYEDNQKHFKNRPVVIINKNTNEAEEELYTISEITSSKPKTPPSYYDEFKEPIIKWKKAGLDKMSFVKSNKLHLVKSDKLYKKIGVMENDDFFRIVKRIIEENS